MKLEKLLVLSALWLTGQSAMAAIVDGVRQKPEPAKTQGFVVSEVGDDGAPTTCFYLYNVGAKAFFTQSNAWGTQASVENVGRKMALVADQTGEGVYTLQQYNWRESDLPKAWRYVFFDSPNAMFCDRNAQNNYYWGVEQGDGTFRLFAASSENSMNADWEATAEGEDNPIYKEGMYVGYDAASSTSALSVYLSEGDGHYIDWAFVSEEDYEALQAPLAAYEAAQKLKAIIDNAKAKGFSDVATYEALYLNEAATTEELTKAASDLNDAFIAWGQSTASVANPADMTAKIVNPKFDNNDLKTGWSTAFNANGGKENAEYWNMNYNTYQTIEKLPAGVYALGAKAFYRAGSNNSSALQNWKAQNDASRYAKLYATVGETTNEVAIVNVFSGAVFEPTGDNGQPAGGDVAVTDTDENGEEITYYLPNNMTRAEYFMHTLGKYDNKLMLAVPEGEALTIGVKKDVNIGDEWSIFDDFTLTYYGNAADAYQLYLDETLKSFPGITVDDGVVYTESYLNAYEEATKSGAKASTLDEANTVIAAVKQTEADLRKNISLWAQWQKDIETAFNKYTVADGYKDLYETGVLADYYDMDDNGDGGPGRETLLAEHSLTNEELEAEIARVKKMEEDILDAYKNAVEPGTDVTNLLKNANFEDGIGRGQNPSGITGDIGTAEGWNVDKRASGNFTGGPLDNNNVNHCFEAWHCHDFDLWQEVSNPPVGVYEVQVQGYVRYEGSGHYTGEQDAPDSPIWLYLNNSLTRFPNVYSETVPEDMEKVVVEDWSWTDVSADGVEYPNSMGAAGQCFNAGMYKKSAFGLVAQKGDKMRIGVKGKMDTDWWCIFDNFKLIYQGFDPTYVKPALEEALTTIDTTQPMGKNAFDKADQITKDAAEAIAANDGQEMFKVLNNAYNLNAEIIESVARFAKLTAAKEELSTAITTAEADASTMSEANTLYSTVDNGITNHSIADDEVDKLIGDINAMMTRLKLPADFASASDDSPVDVTDVIVNPTYENNDNEGWKGTAAGFDSGYPCTAEIFNTANIDYYQDILGLPAGTYEIGVQAFYRAGNAADEYLRRDSTEYNKVAFLYGAVFANNDTTVSAKPLDRLITCLDIDGYEYKELEMDEPVLTDYALVKTDTIDADPAQYRYSFIPDRMMSAFDLFSYYPDNFQKRVVVKVAEGQTLRIGLRKPRAVANDWMYFDEWKLTYYGANSAMQADGDAIADGITEAAAAAGIAKVEFFSLGGAQISKPAKGVTIVKTTMADGTVKVQKILIK